MIDFFINGAQGSTVFLVLPRTEAAHAWVAEHIPEDAQRLGRGIAVEHRYIDAIVAGIETDGLTIST